MQLGPYRLIAPLGVGPAGAIFQAEGSDGQSGEIRLLDRARSDDPAWAALTRRLKLLARWITRPACGPRRWRWMMIRLTLLSCRGNRCPLPRQRRRLPGRGSWRRYSRTRTGSG